MRILVLDDYRPHGESLAEFLQARGHEAIYARSFSEAEWLAELLRFDLALLDFDMPQVTGPAAARKLAERTPGLRSVIVSAHAPTGPRLEELGHLHFIKKPVPTEALLQLISSVEQERAGYSLMLRSVFSITRHPGV